MPKFDVTTTPGLKVRSRGLINYEVDGSGILEAVSFLNRGTERMDKNMAAVHARKLAKLNNLARVAYFSSIRRTGKENFGSAKHVGRRRFTFGGARDTSTAFTGVIFGATTAGNRDGLSGFGYPDRKRADRVTEGAWRVAEFGSDSHPTPAWFKFKSATSGKYASTTYNSRKPDENLMPWTKEMGGPQVKIDGMGFLQSAWDQLFSTDETLSDYRDAVFEAFKK